MSELDVVLADLLAATGARAARVVDGRRGAVLAEVGVAGGGDIAALVRLARDAPPGMRRDETDLVLVVDRWVHVLREADAPGAFLHMRLDRHHRDLACARRHLATTAFHPAVRAALAGPPAAGPSSAGPPPLAQQPALVALAATSPPLRIGTLAALALPPLPSASRWPAAPPVTGAAPRVPLPRRRPTRLAIAPPPDPARATLRRSPVLDQAWVGDPATLRRLGAALRALD